jgi:hypothetical protein
MLPQVLAGLGLFSLLSAGCLFWLQRLQPVFFTLAVASLGYQVWAVRRRPPSMRSRSVKTILGVSVLLNGLLMLGWVVIAIRYR